MRRRLLIVAGAATIGYLVWMRPRLLRWGATDEEAAAALAGDELLESVNTQSTMASTVDTPPEQIWPWLAQMGCDRAGWYSWDWLDNARRHSAEQIIPEWQDLAEGDRLTSTPNGSAYFTTHAGSGPAPSPSQRGRSYSAGWTTEGLGSWCAPVRRVGQSGPNGSSTLRSGNRHTQ